MKKRFFVFIAGLILLGIIYFSLICLSANGACGFI